MAKITLYTDTIADLAIDLDNTDSGVILRHIKKKIDKRLREIEEEERRKNCPIWEELEEIRGCCIDLCSKIGEQGNWQAREGNQNIFIDEQHAKSALAMAKISQLMPYYGGKITDKEWENHSIKKYTIYREDGELMCITFCERWNPIAFHTEDQRDAFMSREENVQLLKDYFMIQN